MKWKPTPAVKVYEALGAVADGRVKVDGNTAKVYSSTGNKYYDIAYDPAASSIMSNDNSSFWQGYLGYPALAFLMQIGVLPYDEQLSVVLKGVAWKDINVKFKNNFEKAFESILAEKGISDPSEFKAYADKVIAVLIGLDLSLLGEKTKPPAGY